MMSYVIIVLGTVLVGLGFEVCVRLGKIADMLCRIDVGISRTIDVRIKPNEVAMKSGNPNGWTDR